MAKRPSPRLACALLVAALGCVLDNPNYDGSGSGGGSLATSAGSTEVSMPLTLAPTSAGPGGTTSGEPSTSTTDPTSAGVTTTSAGSTSEGSSSSGTTSGGSTTGEPADCWGSPWDPWDPVELADANLGKNPRSPRMSPDGYTLYYVAESPGVPHRSIRGDLTEPFIDGEPLALWPNFSGVDHITVRADETEMVMSGQLMMGNDDVLVSVKGVGWSMPTPVGGITTTMDERASTLSEDGARLIFERPTGPVNPVIGATWRLYEATRPANSAPGAAFAPSAPVVLPGITDDSYAHVILCAALSPDGLRLFFGSSYPTALIDGDYGDELYVNVVERPSVDAPWGPPVRLESLQAPTWQSCPDAITRDGCQLSYRRFKFPPDPNEPDGNRIVIARRTP